MRACIYISVQLDGCMKIEIRSSTQKVHVKPCTHNYNINAKTAAAVLLRIKYVRSCDANAFTCDCNIWMPAVYNQNV